ncbi:MULTISPECIES: TetR/AcrR family transcriptional regulator [unclassified Luteococcus]|uniref:TetR/AcrR family transcriptional regulator n=1 Tax=unclassified Luteococcus TaxID=2639923 RepID=UPI00313BFF7F
MSQGYHHGDLRRALLDEAVRLIDDRGPTGVTMRELARRTGVTHAAPMHHFGDRRGLLTAMAVEGLELLTAAMRTARHAGFDEVAVAYVRFARAHPGHYAVMHRPELLDANAPDLVEARAAAARELAGGVRTIPEERRRHVSSEEAAQIAWAMVHGLASLLGEGTLPEESAETVTRRAAHQLFG